MSEPDAALHEFIDAEISVEGLKSPGDEQTLLSALTGQEGVKRAELSGRKLLVEYEPVRIVKARILELVTAAGFRVIEVESAQASPVIDALHEQP
jgi:hypothetical protein